ncbi:hypothetical protein Nstercoris_02000 [Nitrosomonas stercoris]|uniref:Single-stranded DNA-binding protein n=1 Tax=Nitrosomonas stercoris TaxID=1444684 RepID=A0A4Y1YT03_9PROT|nr:hypothetical protein Nstercoris_02000 [Nitrosomonas stercoris]
MKALVLNAKRSQGISKKTGQPYEIYTLTIALPFSQFASKSFTLDGYGYDVAELSLDPEAYPKFSDLKEPRILELQFSTVVLFNELKQVVTGFVATPTPAR